MYSEPQSCNIRFSQLIVKNRCTFCNEATRLFCHLCDIMAEKIMHPACMILDIHKMSLALYSK